MFRKTKETRDIQEIDGHKFEVSYKYKDSFKKNVLIIKDYGEDRGVTIRSEQLFDKVKHLFSKFHTAKVGHTSDEIHTDIEEERDYLVLIDNDGNELHLSGCTSGYTGTGPHGTLEVLNKSGFQIGRRFVFGARTFCILHPDVEIKLYGERL